MTLTCVADAEGHESQVWRISWHPEGNHLISVGSDINAVLWKFHEDIEDSQGTKRLEVDQRFGRSMHTKTIKSVAFHPKGDRILLGSFDATTSLWTFSAADGSVDFSTTLEGHQNEVKDAQYNFNGSHIATCARDKTVWIWEVDDDLFDFNCAEVFSEHRGDVKTVAWHPSLYVLASASYDDFVVVYGRATDGEWRTAASLEGHTSTVWSVDWFPGDGNRTDGAHFLLASGSTDRTVRLWAKDDIFGKWREVFVLSENFHEEEVLSVAFSPCGRFLATGSGDSKLRIFRVIDASTDKPTLELIEEVRAHNLDVNCVRWRPIPRPQPKPEAVADDTTAPTQYYLATSSDQGDVKVWQYIA